MMVIEDIPHDTANGLSALKNVPKKEYEDTKKNNKGGFCCN